MYLLYSQGEGKKRSFPAKRTFLSYHDVKNTYFDRFDTRTAGKIRFFFLLLSRRPASPTIRRRMQGDRSLHEFRLVDETASQRDRHRVDQSQHISDKICGLGSGGWQSCLTHEQVAGTSRS